ncbi:MAG: hypothetical protein WBA89_23440 [Microcoleus sp.]|uniref:hypothetical protein n=1 Tax=Microcoleus sp. TaxID=44472 RepID=UPI003C776CF1
MSAGPLNSQQSTVNSQQSTSPDGVTGNDMKSQRYYSGIMASVYCELINIDKY